MKVLIGCEQSGVVRDAFLRRGHEALSVDLEPSQSEGPHHQGDLEQFLFRAQGAYDVVICFPPCTFLSAASPLNWSPPPARLSQQQDALNFALLLLNTRARIGVCVENPLGLLNRYVKASQIINPYLFGHPIRKRTCLWLRGLPPLTPTKVVRWDAEASRKWFAQGGRKGRGQHRARTFQGVAEAMAEQWGSLSQPFLSPLGF